MPTKSLDRTDLPRLPILHRDTGTAAVSKPSGLVVHRSEFANDQINCLSLLRRQLGLFVYPVHRLDRGASGVLLFALSPESAAVWGKLFRERLIQKSYVALVRGFLPDEGLIDHPLSDEPGRPESGAQTRFQCLARVELPFAVGRYSTARYSLALAEPLTGRLHQIRKHFAHIRHPLMGDTNYGDGKHNQFFRRQFGFSRLALHAIALSCSHPSLPAQISVQAPLPIDFASLLRHLPIGEATLTAVCAEPGSTQPPPPQKK